MERSREWVVIGYTKARSPGVILLRGLWRPILTSCAAAKLHLTQICLVLFVFLVVCFKVLCSVALKTVLFEAASEN